MGRHHENSVKVSITLREDTQHAVAALADAEDLPFSRACDLLLREALNLPSPPDD